MYRRYGPKQGMQPPKQGKPTAGEMGHPRQNQPRQSGNTNRKAPSGQSRPPVQEVPKRQEKKPQLNNNPVLGLLPPSVYNPETKKILGLFSAEDLLLVALIFLLLDSEDGEDSVLVYLLLYVLISDYIDLPF